MLRLYGCPVPLRPDLATAFHPQEAEPAQATTVALSVLQEYAAAARHSEQEEADAWSR